MTMVTFTTKDKIKITIPIKNILFLEKQNDMYCIYLPCKCFEVGRNQFNAIKTFMEEND